MTFLFLLSWILFQLPFGIYQDTIRRFKRMQNYNPVQAFDYEYENGKFEENVGFSAVVFISGFGLGLIPLFQALNFHWLILIVVNIISLSVLVPFVSFLLYPKGSIYTIKKLKLKSIQYLALAVLLLIISLVAV